jgi:hypothetical protein
VCKGFSVGTTPGFLKSDDIWLLLLNDISNEWKPIFSSCKNIVTEDTYFNVVLQVPFLDQNYYIIVDIVPRCLLLNGKLPLLPVNSRPFQ